LTSDQSTQALMDEVEKNSKNFFDEAPCGYVFTLQSGVIIKANQTLLKWIEYSESEVINRKRFQEILTVGCRIYYETNYSPLLQMQGFLNEITLDLLGNDGRVVPVLIHSEAVKDSTGDVLFIRSTLFNISDRRKYERELLSERRRAEQSEQRFKVLSQAGEALRRSFNHIENFKEVVQYVTNDFCDGCTIDLIKGGVLIRVAQSHRLESKIIPPFHLEKNTRLSSEAILTPGALATFPSYVTYFLKEFSPDSAMIVPLLQNDIPIGVIGFYMSELQRKFSPEDFDFARELANRCVSAFESACLQAEKESADLALRESHEWFSTTLGSIGDAVITIKTDKTISYLNPVAEELTGWTSFEAKGRPMNEVFCIINEVTGDPSINPVDKVLKEGIVAGLANDTALIRRDGSRIIIEDSAAPIKTSGGNVYGVVLVFRDVTQKYREERMLKETLNQLQEERVVREKFVDTLSHDLRSPITAAKMSAELILRKISQPEAVQAQAVRVINSVNRADQMIQDLLDANRIRAGEKIPLDMTSCDLAFEVREAVSDLITIHGDRFTVEVPNSVVGIWNCSALRRLIENLCNNGVKYGAPHKSIKVTLISQKDYVIIAVHNEGNPISEKDQLTLFDPYKRTHSAIQSGQRGWGLGLTLVRGVAEAHGGSVSVESSEQNGTTFYVRIPRN
jgi:PAS domain S-box-containing protein